MADIDTVRDLDLVDVGYFALGNILLLMVGFTLGALIRNSPGAIVAYMVYAFIAPGLLTFLAFNQAWFRDARGWVDPKYNPRTCCSAPATSPASNGPSSPPPPSSGSSFPSPSPLSTCFARR